VLSWLGIGTAFRFFNKMTLTRVSLVTALFRDCSYTVFNENLEIQQNDLFKITGFAEFQNFCLKK
jgi:hypothetical protein